MRTGFERHLTLLDKIELAGDSAFLENDLARNEVGFTRIAGEDLQVFRL